MRFIDDYKEMRNYIDNALEGGYSPNNVSALGSAASLVRYIECPPTIKIKKLISCILDYMFKYEITQSTVYMDMAKEELHELDWVYENLLNESEKNEVKSQIDMVHQHINKTGMATTPILIKKEEHKMEDKGHNPHNPY